MTQSAFGRQGFSLLEIAIAVGIVGTALMGILWLQSISQRSAMDSYFELLAVELAREPIEYFRGHGYAWIENNEENIPDRFKPQAVYKFPADGGKYPCEAGYFKREIELKKESSNSEGTSQKSPVPYYWIRVRVVPQDLSKLAGFFNPNEGVALEANIFPEFP
jgi:prepilin-type N-terminal cleavage/methylation domain-containing protein